MQNNFALYFTHKIEYHKDVFFEETEAVNVHSNLNEIFRYLGMTEPIPEDLRQQVSELSLQLSSKIKPRFIYKVFSLLHEDTCVQIPDARITLKSHLACKMLAECNQVVLLACTLGTTFDSMLRSEQARNMSNAVILNACGNALVEQGCDCAEEEIKLRFPDHFLTDRFSPGYGDLSLELQPLLCAALDSPRKLGIHVSDSFLMNPSKSVTALIGLSDRPQMARIRGCAYCAMRDICSIRKGGNRCGA